MISVTDVNEVEDYMRYHYNVVRPEVRSSWFAMGRPGNVACVIIRTPDGWGEKRNTLRLYYRLDTHVGQLEPHEGPNDKTATVLDRDADTEVFNDYWQRDCYGYAPVERRVTRIFGW